MRITIEVREVDDDGNEYIFYKCGKCLKEYYDEKEAYTCCNDSERAHRRSKKRLPKRKEVVVRACKG